MVLDKPRQTRFLRSQQDLKQKQGQKAASGMVAVVRLHQIGIDEV